MSDPAPHEKVELSASENLIFGAESWWAENGRRVLIGTGIAVVAVTGWLLMKAADTGKREAAWAALAGATNAADYLLVAAEKAGTPAGAHGYLVGGDELLTEGKPAEALKAFEAFMAQYPDHPSVVNALLGIAIAREQLKDLDGAISALQQVLAAHAQSYRAAEARFMLAQVFEEKGDKVQARAAYEAVRAQNAQSPWAQQAATALTRLGP
jgi:TolA-binding protein